MKKKCKSKKAIKSHVSISKKRKILTLTSYAFIFSTFLISLILLSNYLYFHNKFYIQTRVGDYYIGGMTISEAETVLNGAITNFQEDTIVVEIDGIKENIPVESFKVKIETEAILNSIYNSQHIFYPDAFSEYIYSISKHFQKYEKAFDVEIEERNIKSSIYTNFKEISPLKEPEISYEEGTFVVLEGAPGKTLTQKSLSYIETAVSYLYKGIYELQTEQNSPQLSSGEISIISDAANEIILKDLTFKSQNINLVEKLSNHPEWIYFDISSTDYANSLFSEPLHFRFGNGIVAGEDTEPVNYNILLNPEEIELYLNENVVQKLDDHAENVYLKLDENKKIVVEGFLKNGYALEKEKSINLIVENFKNNIYETELVISIQEGQFLDQTELNLGIKELVGFGESELYHSDVNRETNVTVGLSKFQNVIIKPGEIFNYADYIGPIDAEHGFLPGWVIKNRTENVLEYGGGICQTSTTLFRAAFYGGFPIVERHPHSYDVVYYRWPKVGLDASVYVPYASMKFRNDSPGHILIQQYVDLESKRAYVWIYGTDDGREVEVTGPDIYAKYWPSTTIDIPSEDLEPGQRVLSKSATAGLKTDWFRKVTYSDGREENYTAHSSYTAVPATYLVGVGE